MKSLLLKTFFIYLLFFILGCEKSESPVDEPDPPQLPPYGEFIDDWTFKVHPSGNFDLAEFKLWTPDTIQDLRAILILCNYNNGNGLGLVMKEEWQEFARQERLALIGVHFESNNANSGHYSTASGGSGLALRRSVDSLAEKQNLHDLKKLPFLMRGYSAGGVFSHSFSAYLPERVIAFANIRGGSLSETTSINNGIPALMLAAENDELARNFRILDVVLTKRDEGGLWCFAMEPNEDHFGGLEKSDELIRAFFTITLEKRLMDGSDQLQPIAEDSGWLGQIDSLQIFPFSTYPHSKSDASWLIDEPFANLWRAYQEE